jgi:hypothetical protein
MGYYEVPGMTLIPQKMNSSCWYASVQMLIRWREDRAQASLKDLIPPEFDVQCAMIRDNNTGILNPQIVPMAKRVGLHAVPPLCPTTEALESWLRTYGPLWVNGKTHIVVIAGINSANLMVKIYDPWPPNVGGIDWRSLVSWYAFGTSPSSRDAGMDVETVFLYVPI